MRSFSSAAKSAASFSRISLAAARSFSSTAMPAVDAEQRARIERNRLAALQRRKELQEAAALARTRSGDEHDTSHASEVHAETVASAQHAEHAGKDILSTVSAPTFGGHVDDQGSYGQVDVGMHAGEEGQAVQPNLECSGLYKESEQLCSARKEASCPPVLSPSASARETMSPVSPAPTASPSEVPSSPSPRSSSVSSISSLSPH